MITEQLMKPGSWSLELVPDTPQDVTLALREFGHIVITPNPVAPVSAHTDAELKSIALYAGVLTAKRTPTSLSGPGLGAWMGDGDGKGTVLGPTGLSVTNVTLSSFMASLLPAGLPLEAGVVTNTGLNNITGVWRFINRRAALDAACLQAGAEWRVRYDGTVDAADPELLFRFDPSVIVVRDPGGIDGSGLRGLQNAGFDAGLDADDWSSQIIAIGQSPSPGTFGSATIGVNPYKDYRGNAAAMQRIVQATEATDSAALGNVATSTLNLFSSAKRSVRLVDDTYAVPLWVRPGDWLYLYDPGQGMFDVANQVTYRGDAIAPMKVRAHTVAWPVRRGLGVYYRDADGGYLDLTDYVAWETGPNGYELGRGAVTISGATPGNPGSAAPLFGGTMTSYTATLTGSTSNPNLGSTGGITAAYTRLGDLVHVSFRAVWGGAGVSAGSGTYFVSAPFTPNAAQPSQFGGTGRVARAAGGNEGLYATYVDSNGRIQLRYTSALPTGTGTTVGSATPFAWGTAGDTLEGSLSYFV